MRWARLILLDMPAFVIGTWARLYLFVVAVGSLIVWGTLIAWLLRVAWTGRM